MRVRHRVLGLLVLLSVITYMDRICISHAGRRMQEELSISPERWGWVLGAFMLGYGVFEIPSGAWGDRRGQRGVLTRIVIWWSAFTMLTGMAFSYPVLVVTRFFFGAGEAGAYPNASGSVARWFPSHERARAQGFIWGASRIGGAVTPLVTIPLIQQVGWRGAFTVFGAIGLVWALVWWIWYRDHPAQHSAVTASELAELDAGGTPRSHVAAPWLTLFGSPRLWLLMTMYSCYVWGSIFYLSWFPDYLTKGRGFSEAEMSVYAALPFVMGALGNLAGGVLSDHLSRTRGLNVGRRLMGSCCLALSALCLLATAFVDSKFVAVALLAAGFGIMDCMLPCAWALCLDIGREHAGAVSGAMNTAGQAGGLMCTVLFGYLIAWYGDYNLPLIVIAAMVFVSAILFLTIDPTRPLIPDSDPTASETVTCD
jgi:ACS family glucarate transporter-like MFS transporter